MRVCVLSDTHNAHKALSIPPDVDVLCCCGDFTDDGAPGEDVNTLALNVDAS